MSEMSPLAKFLMMILRSGSIITAALLVLFAGISIYQKITPEGQLAMEKQDWTFLAVLAVMLALAIYLVRSISKEINGPK
jgi:uncharacterized membrane protein YjfL (UPF0719 family)